MDGLQSGDGPRIATVQHRKCVTPAGMFFKSCGLMKLYIERRTENGELEGHQLSETGMQNTSATYKWTAEKRIPQVGEHIAT
jgi:hypothetical protein